MGALRGRRWRAGRRRSPRLRTAVAALAALAVAAALSACGGEAGADGRDDAGGDPGPVHVHGLGVDPADGSLVIATHTGLWRLPAGETRARRVSDERQDTMGLTVAGPRRYLGSGHPDLRSDLPPHLGLVESDDGGRTWRSVSLLGRADFHVLEVAGRHVYGFDARGGRLLASADGGETWRARSAPEPLIDLAIHPRDPAHLVATGERGLHRSRDGGATWAPVGADAGLLTWPAADRMLLVRPGGDVRASADGGRTWRALSSVRGEPAALAAASREEAWVALHDGRILRSRDGGATWSTAART